MNRFIFGSLLSLSAMGVLAAPAAADCNAVKAAVQEVNLPAKPFGVAPSADGCAIFVSLVGKNKVGAVLAMKRGDGRLGMAGVVKTEGYPFGIALTRDQKLLLVATDGGVAFYDSMKLATNQQDARLGHIDTGEGAVYVKISQDDKLAFVSNEWAKSISVVDLAKARATGFSDRAALIGKIPVGKNPVGLAFSPDGKTLYATSQIMWGFDWPGECKAENERAKFTSNQGYVKEGHTGVHGEQDIEVDLKGPHREGAIFAIDVAKAAVDPEGAVLAKLPAGCNPVRVAVSNDGAKLYVTARGDGELRVFDAAKVRDEAKTAEIARIPVGKSPVGIVVTQDGRVLVADSERFEKDSGEKPQNLTVIDEANLKTIGKVLVGGFPREIVMTADGQVLVMGNYGTKNVKLLDIKHLPMAK